MHVLNDAALTVPPPASIPPWQIAYAESTGECRRSLLMHHFGERGFGPEQCAGTCDVCQQLAAGGKQVGRRSWLIGQGDPARPSWAC